MNERPHLFPRFFVTTPAPCPYLPGRTERKIFTELQGGSAADLNEALGRIGFRRSQNIAYRPSCDDCHACVSVRVVAGAFESNATQKRLMKRNADLEISACRPWSTEEQFDLLQRYLSVRHPAGGMNDMDAFDYGDMVEQTPVHSWVIEYREPTQNGRPGRLIGACLTDQQSDGLSMIYSFYEPGLEHRKGMGTFIILDHIMRARASGLPYVYLGYWIAGCDRMRYKIRFRPVESLTPAGWQLHEDKQEG